ncbi:MAG: alpha/beta fold hydrolase [Candidatus Eremiobacteraeota bacterium]|nr:alpha/beta fold hydrolase [Candidatus Eremiobacteraeota bacterium]
MYMMDLASRFTEQARAQTWKMRDFMMLMADPPVVMPGQTPSRIIYRRHRTALRHYEPAGPQVFRTPVLIVYAMVNRPYIMDLLPGRSIIELLVKHGFDVFLLDWGTPRKCDSDKGIESYLEDYLDVMADKTLSITGTESLTIMGYCMGGTLSLIYTALHREKVKNLVLMAAPFDSSSDEALLFQWSREVPVHEISEIFGNCPGWLIGSSFLWINPLQAGDKMKSLYQNASNKAFTDLFFAMEKWLNDTVDVPGRAYTELITWCYKENLLASNSLFLGGRHADLKSITCPCLNIMAELDTSVPPSSSAGIGPALGSTDTAMLSCPVGHIGLAVSGKALKSLWPGAMRWMEERSGPLTARNHSA